MTAISPLSEKPWSARKLNARRSVLQNRAESNQRGGRPDRGQGRGPGQGGQGQQRSRPTSSGQGYGQGQGQRQSAGQGNQSGNFAGAGTGGGRGRDGGGGRGQGSGSRGGQSGRGGQQRGGSRGGDRGRDGGRGGASQPIIVTSKKPKAPITKEMVEGNAPLRSFSDLFAVLRAQAYRPACCGCACPNRRIAGKKQNKLLARPSKLAAVVAAHFASQPAW